VKENTDDTSSDKMDKAEKQNGVDTAKAAGADSEKPSKSADAMVAPPELPHGIKNKLRRLEKFEATYPGKLQP
jgi:hypothetical protein